MYKAELLLEWFGFFYQQIIYRHDILKVTDGVIGEESSSKSQLLRTMHSSFSDFFNDQSSYYVISLTSYTFLFKAGK